MKLKEDVPTLSAVRELMDSKSVSSQVFGVQFVSLAGYLSLKLMKCRKEASVRAQSMLKQRMELSTN
jgi:hypothetical protein